MLSEIDSLVVDLQDVGVRCYTYISCMRYVMEACFEEGVEVVVLDRPNPLGGKKVAGPSMDEVCMSYVGAFQIPFVHGMTIGELALWSKKSVWCSEDRGGESQKRKIGYRANDWLDSTNDLATNWSFLASYFTQYPNFRLRGRLPYDWPWSTNGKI